MCGRLLKMSCLTHASLKDTFRLVLVHCCPGGGGDVLITSNAHVHIRSKIVQHFIYVCSRISNELFLAQLHLQQIQKTFFDLYRLYLLFIYPYMYIFVYFYISFNINRVQKTNPTHFLQLKQCIFHSCLSSFLSHLHYFNISNMMEVRHLKQIQHTFFN